LLIRIRKRLLVQRRNERNRINESESAGFLTLFVLILFNEENENEDGLFGGGEALVRKTRIMKIFLQGGKLAVSLTLMFLIEENEDEDGLFGGG
jgi:hypothetical protein